MAERGSETSVGQASPPSIRSPAIDWRVFISSFTLRPPLRRLLYTNAFERSLNFRLNPLRRCHHPTLSRYADTAPSRRRAKPATEAMRSTGCAIPHSCRASASVPSSGNHAGGNSVVFRLPPKPA